MGSNSNSNFLRKLEVLNQLIYNENKNIVIDAKIGNLNELTKVLSVKEQAQEQLLVVIKALGIGKIVRNLKFEKAQGYSLTLKQRKEQFKEKRNAKNPDYARKAECDESKHEMARRFSEYESLGALFHSERDRLQVLTLWSRTLEEVRHLLEVLSREAGVDLLACLSTVAARKMADFSTKVWAHLLCDSDDYAMPDLD